MHDSFTPLAGLIQLFNLKNGEVIFGGTGSCIVSMMPTRLITIFIAGLMLGRTPEYPGKKTGAKEMKLVMISLVATGGAILFFFAATPIPPGTTSHWVWGCLSDASWCCCPRWRLPAAWSASG